MPPLHALTIHWHKFQDFLMFINFYQIKKKKDERYNKGIGQMQRLDEKWYPVQEVHNVLPRKVWDPHGRLQTTKIDYTPRRQRAIKEFCDK